MTPGLGSRRPVGVGRGPPLRCCEQARLQRRPHTFQYRSARRRIGMLLTKGSRCRPGFGSSSSSSLCWPSLATLAGDASAGSRPRLSVVSLVVSLKPPSSGPKPRREATPSPLQDLIGRLVDRRLAEPAGEQGVVLAVTPHRVFLRQPLDDLRDEIVGAHEKPVRRLGICSAGCDQAARRRTTSGLSARRELHAPARGRAAPRTVTPDPGRSSANRSGGSRRRPARRGRVVPRDCLRPRRARR